MRDALKNFRKEIKPKKIYQKTNLLRKNEKKN